MRDSQGTFHVSSTISIGFDRSNGNRPSKGQRRVFRAEKRAGAGFHFSNGGTGNAFASLCSRAHFSDYLAGNKSALSHGTGHTGGNKKKSGREKEGKRKTTKKKNDVLSLSALRNEAF